MNCMYKYEVNLRHALSCFCCYPTFSLFLYVENLEYLLFYSKSLGFWMAFFPN